MTEFQAAWAVGDLSDRIALSIGYLAGLASTPVGIAVTLLVAGVAGFVARRCARR